MHPEMKTCTKCSETKLLEEFCRVKTMKDGRQSWCKKCEKARSKAYRKANLEKCKARAANYHVANKEKINTKNRDRYAANPEKSSARKKADRLANPEKFKARSRAYIKANKEKIKVRDKVYREVYKEKISASRKVYYAVNREKIKAREKVYREANPGKSKTYRDTNLEKCRVYERAYGKKMNRKANPKFHARRTAWCKANAEKGAEYTRRRRAHKVGTAVGAQPLLVSVVVARDGNKCYLCGKHVRKKDRTFDHVMPLSKGGAHSYGNIRLCCSHCNKSKGARLPHEHMRIRNTEALSGAQLRLLPPGE